MELLIPLALVAAVAAWWWFLNSQSRYGVWSPLSLAFTSTAAAALFILSGTIGYTLDRHARTVAGTPWSGSVVWWVPARFALEADGAGNWSRDGFPRPDLRGALDVDLGFTPATNTLPIRRLALPVGRSAPVRSAWLRFPELRLEPLEQTYTREAELAFRYRAMIDGEPFIARLETDAFGRVVRDQGLWEAE